MNSDLPAPVGPSGRMSRQWLIITLSLSFGIFVGGLAAGGELERLAIAGAESLPFMALALLAYLGAGRPWVRVLALLWLLAILLVYSLANVLYGYALLFPPLPDGTETAINSDAGASLRMLGIVAGGALSLMVGFAFLFRPVRLAFSRFLPIDPDSFVHTVALVAVVGVTLTSFVPLLVLSQPPLLAMQDPQGGGTGPLSMGRDAWGMLRDDLYGLVWMIPASVVAVGFGIRRDLRAALDRLGLVRPTWRQVGVGLAVGVSLVAGANLLDMGTQWLWDTMGWSVTNQVAVERLMGYTLSPVGAVVVGVSAGLGEELAVRGVLQPRLGLLLSNLFFTGLHALQYNWDALVTVFVLGLVFGLVRNRTNTTTSAITHGSYDFLLTIGSVLQIPGF